METSLLLVVTLFSLTRPYPFWVRMARCRTAADAFKTPPFKSKPCLQNPHNLSPPPQKKSILHNGAFVVLIAFIVFWVPHRLSAKISSTAIMLEMPGKGGTNSSFFCKCPTRSSWTSSAQVCLRLDSVKSYCSSFSFRLLRHHDHLLARTNSSCLRFVPCYTVPT